MSSNTSVTHFFAIEGQSKPTNKKVQNSSDTEPLYLLDPTLFVQTLLIMDEVDGMSSGDKGGVSELIKVIPTSQVTLCHLLDSGFWALNSLSQDPHCMHLQRSRCQKGQRSWQCVLRRQVQEVRSRDFTI